MRSRKSLALAAAVLLLVPAAAFAYSGGWTIDARGGLGLPMGDYKDDFKSGLLIGVDASKMVSPQLAIGVDGDYIKNSVTDQNRTALELLYGPGTDADNKFTHYGAHLKYMLSTKEGNKMIPYLVGGGGLYHAKQSITNSVVSASPPSETKFGLRGGVGLNLMMSPKMGLGFQADYNDIFTDGGSTQYIGVSGGLHFVLTPSSAGSSTH